LPTLVVVAVGRLLDIFVSDGRQGSANTFAVCGLTRCIKQSVFIILTDADYHI